MLHAHLYLLTISILKAATVETALLGPGSSAGPTPLSAIDSRGNVILVNISGSGCDAQQYESPVPGTFLTIRPA